MSKNETLIILLAEDNEADARLTMELLKESHIFNIIIYHVIDGVETMNFLSHKEEFTTAPRPDIIILDLNMPRKDGREVLNEMRANPDLMSIPVIVLTTSENYDDVKTSYQLQCNAYIVKPIDLEKFITVLKSIEDFWFNTVQLPV